jgi:voltage-gated potassium channel
MSLSGLKPHSTRGSLTTEFGPEIRELVIYVGTVLLVVSIGTLGYMQIEGWNVLDSVYMTVITLASVGFMEVHPLSSEGRVFTIVLIAVGLGLVTVLFTTIAQFIIHRQILWAFRGKRMLDRISKLNDHIIFCGFGRLSRFAAQSLGEQRENLVIIEREPQRAQSAREEGYMVLEGDATNEEVLAQAGIKKAKKLVCLLAKDADNLYVILTSRELSPKIFIVSRSEDEASEKLLKRAGADRLISPYRIGGQRIAQGLRKPYVTDFLDLALSSSGERLQLEELRIPHNSPVAGRTLRDSDIRRRTNVIVAGIAEADGKMLFNPSGDAVIQSGTTLIALGLRPDLERLEDLLFERER